MLRSRPLFLAAGGYHLALGLLMAVAPRRFFDDVAAFPPYNEHFIRDLATFYLALGAVLLVAAARTAWQVPLLVFAVVQYALHLVNHIVDVGDTVPAWMGPAQIVAIALVGLALAALLRRSQP